MALLAESKPEIAPPVVAVVGKESAGKSQLISSLTRQSAYSANFRGSTLSCEIFEDPDGRTFVDTPGILRQSDSITTRLALNQLSTSDFVLLVLPATHAKDDLTELLPLVEGKFGAVVLTFWDRLPDRHQASSRERVESLACACGVQVIPVDARSVSAEQRQQILDALENPARFETGKMELCLSWRCLPRPTLLENRWLGPVLASLLLLGPAVAAVWLANQLAGLLDPRIQKLVAPLVAALAGLHSLPHEILAGPYGLITMGPLLLVWAAPTVALFSLGLGIYKASGLLDRISTAIHPLILRVGLTGRDVVRVVMGFGCNVPAVINTRACSSCSRPPTVAAIAFGSACSYQLSATLAVFAAAGRPGLALPYLLYLVATTLIYLRLTSPAAARSPLNVLVAGQNTFLTWPRWSSIWHEARLVLAHFFKTAVPVFLVISGVASLLSWLGVVPALARLLGPVMRVFGLPAEAALPVVMASIRKDGLLLFAQQDSLTGLSSAQILTGVYLAGVLLPCLVTALTIGREQSPRFTLKLMARQALAASVFAFALSWLARLW
ncbi:MAG: nucleoside recognition domain-containing protein [Thermoanaerobaculia bacterium]